MTTPNFTGPLLKSKSALAHKYGPSALMMAMAKESLGHGTSMKTIKFSHFYQKLDGMVNHTAVLLDVLPVKLEDLSAEFLAFDTDSGRFKLPKRGNYLLLIFKGYTGLFPTLRAAWPTAKLEYYRSAIGEEFKIEIK